ILIKDSKNQMGMLKNGESGYLMDGDTIKLGAKEIPFKEQEQTIFPIKNSFSAFIDFEKEVEPSIEQVNKNSIDKLKGVLNKDVVPQQKEITFASVGGQAEAIKALKKNILYPIKHPELNGGNNMNKSVLLYGPPGTGKSLLAEATANEAGVWHKKINASELESKWVGESEKNWRDLFGEARENQPAIIFIDEFDAVAKKRGGHDVYGDKTLNTVLGLMSDAEKRGDEIYMIAATNNKAALDEAAIRSGRFGIAIEVGAPDLQGVKQTLDIYTKTQPMAKDFNYDAAADKIHKQKATGADIASITKDARNNAIEREQIYDKMDAGTYTPEDMKKLKIKNEDFDKAIETFAKSKNETKKPINPIGFNSPTYNK
ncbi:MAG: AAA family ATPase, partial [Candidatus Gastranaerophilales bacterium]|nr:AAA family ATPase [Candidatus Gastranaerophilales bacterium]